MKMMRFFYFLPVLIVAIAACHTDTAKKNSNPNTASADTSLDSINSVLDENPNNPEALHARAKIYIQRKMFDEALTDMKQAVQLDSMNSSYFITMADLSIAANRSFNAKMFLERAISLDSANTDAIMRLAELNLIVRKYSESLNLLNGVLKKDNKNTTALLMRGFVYKETGDTNNAINDFRSAIEIDPDYYNAYMQLGMIFQLRNNPISEGYFNNAIRINPKSEEALYGRGLWYQEHNQLDKAIIDYTTITQLNPKNKSAHFNLGYIHQIYLKVFAEAVKHYTRAIDADAHYAEAFYNRGLCYEGLGNLQAAQNDFRSAIANRSDYILAQEGLQRVTK